MGRPDEACTTCGIMHLEEYGEMNDHDPTYLDDVDQARAVFVKALDAEMGANRRLALDIQIERTAVLAAYDAGLAAVEEQTRAEFAVDVVSQARQWADGQERIRELEAELLLANDNVQEARQDRDRMEAARAEGAGK